MRRLRHAVWVVALACAAAPAAADEVTASGSLGAGVFGAQAASSADAGLDFTGDRYAIGVGGRARWVVGEGFRSEEWDEASEMARVVRYALFSWRQDEGDEHAAAVSAAVGELGGVSLGHGSIVDGYASGLDVDHGHLGAQVRAGGGAAVGELVVDDVVAPRIAAARVAFEAAEPLVLGASVAGDRVAPAMTGAGPAMDRELAAAIGVDGALGARSDDGAMTGALTADLVGLVGLGAGLHLGAEADGLVDDGVRVGARAELRTGSAGYLPGWFGPLYERDRRALVGADDDSRGQVDAARAGGLAGLGGAGRLWIEAPGALGAQVGYGARRGVADLVTARVSAPYWHRVQAALWSAALMESATETEALALAVEVRARLPRGFFLRGEAARMIQTVEEDAGPRVRPIWLAQIAFGHVLGESDAE